MIKSNSKRLAIGTAQFGSDYGIANTSGEVSEDTIFKVLSFAYSKGIDTLDTAISYGRSEEKLGKVGVKDWNVISKVPSLSNMNGDINTFINLSVFNSLERLKINNLKGLLLHSPDDLLSKNADHIYNSLINLKDQGLINNVGISIYDSSILSKLLKRFKFDIIQFPLNLLDKRFIEEGWLDYFKDSSIELHARSIFLQGLLLMKSEERSNYFSKWNNLWKELDDWHYKNKQTCIQSCLNHNLSYERVDKLVIGIDTFEHLEHILTLIDSGYKFPDVNIENDKNNLLNPYFWEQ